jgi:hypothetical protein
MLANALIESFVLMDGDQERNRQIAKLKNLPI